MALLLFHSFPPPHPEIVNQCSISWVFWKYFAKFIRFHLFSRALSFLVSYVSYINFLYRQIFQNIFILWILRRSKKLVCFEMKKKFWPNPPNLTESNDLGWEIRRIIISLECVCNKLFHSRDWFVSCSLSFFFPFPFIISLSPRPHFHISRFQLIFFCSSWDQKLPERAKKINKHFKILTWWLLGLVQF